MWFIQFFSGLAACAVASVWNPGQADVITDWNQVTLDVIRADQTPPPPATRILAMVHIAMYEAVNGIHGQYEPYLLSRPAPPGASPEAAAATAAHRVLVDQYPDLKKELDAVLAESLAAIGDPSARQKGQAWERFCGNQVVQWRRHDGTDTTIFYEPSGLFGHWQPTPPDFAPALLPQWPYVAPFAIRSPRQFPVPPPPPFISPDYAVALHEVKAYGDVDSTVRTVDQTLIAYFWEDGPGTVTPPGHWQVIAQQLAEQFGNTLGENARLFALLSLTQADGAIHAWYTKYDYDHVRPYTAIVEEADDDGNPNTRADPT